MSDKPKPSQTLADGEKLQINTNKVNSAQENNSQNKSLIQCPEKQCYSRDMIVIETEKDGMMKQTIVNSMVNWRRSLSRDDNSHVIRWLISCTIFMSQTLLILTGVKTLKMMVHFYLRYRILFSQTDLVSIINAT